MTINEAILKSLDEIGTLASYTEVYKHIEKNSYYDFGSSKTPSYSVSGRLTNFIKKGDKRVKRVKKPNGSFLYYLSKNENTINFNEEFTSKTNEAITTKKSFEERDLHILLSSYLKNENIFSKTIFHEKSSNSKDNHQKWIHPDMVGVNFLVLNSKVGQTLLRAIKKADSFRISSYELKKEISTDYELKKSYFQAVSNSSWANYGYLVAFEINNSLTEEIERLNQSFGIGVIELKPNPFESKVLFQSKYRTLDFKTIDKLCKINKDFESFTEQVEKVITVSEKYLSSTTIELENLCDKYLINDSEIETYCKRVGIPNEAENEGIIYKHT